MTATLLTYPSLEAATIVVNETTCTLVDAITSANTDTATGGCTAGSGADLIELSADVTLTATNNTDGGGNNGLPSITSDITIKGVGAHRQIERFSPIDEFRFFYLNRGKTLELENVTLTNGNESTGGAILNRNGKVILTNSTLVGNTASFGGGAVFNGSSTLEASTLTLVNSTVSNNSAGFGGGVYNNGEYLDDTVTLNYSTLSGNTASFGGGIYSIYGTVRLTNSTISGNTASSLGGGFMGFDPDTLLTNSTLSGNSAPEGGAIRMGAASATLRGTIIANSPTGGNCFGTIVDSGGNLADDSTCGTIPNTLTGLDATLADNGGPTLTHALLAGSTAIDAAGACGLATDQRGGGRKPPCDSGAFEALGCELLEIENQTIDDIQDFSTCNTAVLGPDLTIEGPSGLLTVEAGFLVTMRNGFRVGTGAELEVTIDPSLLPP